MSVIDDNKMKLLKMKEKILSLNSNDAAALEEYRRVACDIDMDLYISITDKIQNNKDYINYPLEKQLEFFEDIEREYSEYYNFQKNIIMICNRYFIQGFNLTDSSLIRIDEIRKRIITIKKYLENETEIEKNRLELDRLNSNFIDEEQKADLFQDRVSLLDKELKDNVLKAEGRINSSSGGIEYVSILTEAKSLGIDLKQALEDDELVDKELEKAESEYDEINGRLKSAQICYENDSNVAYREIYYNIMKENISIQYKLTFLRILQLVNSHNVTYKQASRKRVELANLIKDRVSLLGQLGVKYLYDPFDRIGLNEQLELIKAFGNNYDNVKNIRRTIDEISGINDEKIAENKKYADYFKVSIELFGNEEEVVVLKEPEPSEVVDNFYAHNKVVGVDGVPTNFKLDRAHQKTQEVIKRIYGIIAGKDTSDVPYDVSPSLVIEESDDTKIFDNFDVLDDDDDDLVATNSSAEVYEADIDDKTTNLFVETNPSSLDSEGLFTEVQPFEIAADAQAPDSTGDVLFTEVQPFEEPQLFEDRYDDGTVLSTQEPLFTDTTTNTNDVNTQMPSETVSTSNSTQDVGMPDVFWETSKEPIADDAPQNISFDDQIAALISDGDKVRKLVS